MRRITLCIPLALLTACDPEATSLKPITDVHRTDLRALLGDGARPSGITVDPETGQRYLLEPELGIIELTPEGPRSLWSPTPELPELTDLCIMAGARFIAAADGDGYVVDIAEASARQHFCLEPGWDEDFDPEPEPDPADPPPPALRHANRAVVCDVAARRIYGQPQTLPREGEPQPLRSEIASYHLDSGEDLTWQALPDAAYHAGGMALLEPGVLLLGAGSQLSVFDLETGAFAPGADLARHGVETIEALAIDVRNDRLLVLDGADGELVDLPLRAAR